MPASTKATTIYEIAKHAGVSSSTVARVLRGDVKEAWPSTARRAARIRKLADEMGYRTNWRARAFSEQRTWTVALFYPESHRVTDGIHGDIVEGLNSTLQSKGYSLMLMPVENEHFESTVKGSRLDGYATLGQGFTGSTRELLDGSGLPEVILNSEHAPDLASVVVDEFGGGYAAAKHLLELGHREIGFYLNAEADWHYSIDGRRNGVDAAMREFGLDHGPDFYRVDHHGIEAVLRDPEKRPTAMICYSHFEANPVLSVMYQLNLRIPDAMSVVGFNDVRGEATSPPLTTVSYDGHRMGKLAAQLLLRRIGGDVRQDSRCLTIKHHLTVRSSTAPVSRTD